MISEMETEKEKKKQNFFTQQVDFPPNIWKVMLFSSDLLGFGACFHEVKY